MSKFNLRKALFLSITFILISAIAVYAMDFKDWGDREQVTVDKIWTVSFDREMLLESINDFNIYVLNDETEQKHPVTLQLSDDKKVVTITPDEDYQFDTNYTLYITTDVLSTEHKPLREAIKKPFVTSLNYKTANINGLQDFTIINTYKTFNEAYAEVKKDDSQVILLGEDSIIWATDGIVRTKGYTIIYDHPNLLNSKTYVNTKDHKDVELQYVQTLPHAIEIKIAGTTGYISHTDATIVPQKYLTERSYYEVVLANDETEYLLYHHIYTNGKYENYLYGWAPDWLEEGKKYYSWDGIHFEEQQHKLFNQLDINLKTNYTAEELDSYIAENSLKDTDTGQAPLGNLGETFIKAEETYGVNALFLMSLAIHESSWGQSKLAQEKNNLFGLNAHDDDPFGKGDNFNSFEDSIMHAAKFIKEMYLDPTNWRHEGPYAGNKAFGLNVRYASDPYWGQKVAGHMYRADRFLGGKDRELLH
ncbi:glucosaminidase domain-containing protein [Bacillaceae bacterium W0354]